MLSNLILLTAMLPQMVAQQATHHCPMVCIVPKIQLQLVLLQLHSNLRSLDKIMVKVVNLLALLLLRQKR